MIGKCCWNSNRARRPGILSVTGCRFSLVIFTCLLVGAIGSLKAATLLPGFTESLVANGLPGPTAMDFAPDGRLFVCLQSGQLRVIKNGALLATPFVSLPVDSSGERGLLGVAFDPNFATNNYVYVYYTVAGSPPHNRVSRFTADGDGREPEQESRPLRVRGRPGRRLDQLPERRADDERQHQELVDVEREADRGDYADQPLGSGEMRHEWGGL